MPRSRKAIAYVALAVSAGLLAAGLAFGQIAVVLDKAAKVCLECIGIG